MNVSCMLWATKKQTLQYSYNVFWLIFKYKQWHMFIEINACSSQCNLKMFCYTKGQICNSAIVLLLSSASYLCPVIKLWIAKNCQWENRLKCDSNICSVSLEIHLIQLYHLQLWNMLLIESYRRLCNVTVHFRRRQ